MYLIISWRQKDEEMSCQIKEQEKEKIDKY